MLSYVVCVRVCDPLTNVAVLPCPSLVTLTLPVFTNSVLAAQWVAGLLVTHTSSPALLTAAYAAVTHSMSATVHFTHLCNSNKEKLLHRLQNRYKHVHAHWCTLFLFHPQLRPGLHPVHAKWCLYVQWGSGKAQYRLLQVTVLICVFECCLNLTLALKELRTSLFSWSLGSQHASRSCTATEKCLLRVQLPEGHMWSLTLLYTCVHWRWMPCIPFLFFKAVKDVCCAPQSLY